MLIIEHARALHNHDATSDAVSEPGQACHLLILEARAPYAPQNISILDIYQELKMTLSEKEVILPKWRPQVEKSLRIAPSQVCFGQLIY